MLLELTFLACFVRLTSDIDFMPNGLVVMSQIFINKFSYIIIHKVKETELLIICIYYWSCLKWWWLMQVRKVDWCQNDFVCATMNIHNLTFSLWAKWTFLWLTTLTKENKIKKKSFEWIELNDIFQKEFSGLTKCIFFLPLVRYD